MEDDAASDDDGLPNFQTIDTSVDVYSVRAEDCETAHVDIVENAYHWY